MLRKCAIALLLSWPPLAAAQFIGYTTAQSTVQTLFSNQSGNATSVIITNLGQSSHFVTVCNQAFAGTVILESSKDGTFNPPNTMAAANYSLAAGASTLSSAISPKRKKAKDDDGAPPAPPAPRSVDSSCHLIQAGGYYPTMRVRITNWIQGSTSIFYSGIGGPVAPAPAALSTIGPTSPVACDLTTTNPGLASGLPGVNLAQGFPGQTIIVCSLTVSFAGPTTAGAVIFGADTSGGSGQTCPAFVVKFNVAVTAATPQVLHFLGGPGGLFRLAPGNSLCISTGPVGSNTVVNATFAQITF